MTQQSQVVWAEVVSRLDPAPNYWLATNGRDGFPHAAPVWGVVVDESLYFYSTRSTAKAKNLAADPRVVVHLESGNEVVIVRGTLDDLGAPSMSPAVVAALDVKYDDPEDAVFLPSNDPSFDALYRLRPERALLWELADYDNTQRRWSAR